MNAESPSPTDVRHRRFTSDERAYFIARLVLLFALVGFYLMGIAGSEVLGGSLYLGALALLLFDTVSLGFAIFVMQIDVDRAMMLVVPPDLVAFTVFIYLHAADDGFYVVVIVVAVIYALVVGRRDALLVSAGAASAYLLGHLAAGRLPVADYVLLALKTLAVPVLALLVADSVSKRRIREQEAEQSTSETERLNEALRQRVSQMQAVTSITEMVHSSLDFDSVGPGVLEIVAGALGMGSCCLFVIDKVRSETMFSASRGTTSTLSTPMDAASYSEAGDSHLTCIPVFDHGPTMVLFCAFPEELAGLSPEERVVLGAVASELVVAVENSRLYKLTSHLAVTDELTGLANYRRLQQRLEEELARSKRFGKHLSLLMIDADDFKSFNDAQGHPAGDRALAGIAAILRSAVREIDVVARYGGEEFAVVLPETDAAGAYVVAEKIREAVQLHLFADADGHKTCHLSISIGVAAYPTHGADHESLLRAADDALYHAKDSGKDRVRAPLRYGAAKYDPESGDAVAMNDDLTGV